MFQELCCIGNSYGHIWISGFNLPKIKISKVFLNSLKTELSKNGFLYSSGFIHSNLANGC